MNLIRKDIYNNLSGFGTGFGFRSVLSLPSISLSLSVCLSVSLFYVRLIGLSSCRTALSAAPKQQAEMSNRIESIRIDLVSVSINVDDNSNHSHTRTQRHTDSREMMYYSEVCLVLGVGGRGSIGSAVHLGDCDSANGQNEFRCGPHGTAWDKRAQCRRAVLQSSITYFTKAHNPWINWSSLAVQHPSSSHLKMIKQAVI